MVLVGPSLGGAAAIDFTLSHPEAVSSRVFFMSDFLLEDDTLYTFKSACLILKQVAHRFQSWY